MASVRPILDERNADLGKKVDQRFAEVDALLEKYRQGDGFVFYDKVTEPQRQELSRAIDALSQGSKPGARCHRPTVTRKRPAAEPDPPRAGLSRRKLFGAAGVTAAVVGAAGAGALAGRASAASTDFGDLHQPVPFRGERQAGIITAAAGPDALRRVRRHDRQPRRRHRTAASSGPQMAERMTQGEEAVPNGAVGRQSLCAAGRYRRGARPARVRS